MAERTSKILVVDDNMNNVQVLAGILENNGFEVEFALNGPDALQWLAEENFDLILLDVMMPEMDGFEVCQRVLQQEKYRDLPIIFLTAKTDKESIVKGFECGGKDYLLKPYDQRELLARVTTHLELKHSRDQLAGMNEMLEQKIRERTVELREAYEKMMELNNRLVELDDAKSEFLRLISHQIRTPLNGIKGFTEILKASKDSNPIVEFVDLLEESVMRLERFSLNALLITSLRLNKKKLALERFRLGEMVAGVLEQFSDNFREKGITVITDLPERQELIADRELIGVCLGNIVRNALRFARAGGNVHLAATTGGELRISVVDDGPGFSAKALEHLFDFLVEGGNHVDENEGLGLALAHQIMLAHHGKVEVKNLVPHGAAVTLVFPAEKDE